MNHLVFLSGRPYSGKGTVAKVLKNLGFVAFSAGDEYRRHIKDDTEIGRNAKWFNERGLLVPDPDHLTVFNAVWPSFFEINFGRGLICDGLIRTPGQAVIVGLIRNEKFCRNYKMVQVVLDVSERECLRRFQHDLNNGGNPDRGRRIDDDPAVMPNRMAEYRLKTEPGISVVETMGVRTVRIPVRENQPIELTIERALTAIGCQPLSV